MCVFLVLAILFILIDIAIRPVVKKKKKYIVKNEVTIMINESVEKYLSENEMIYSDLVNVGVNGENEVTSISTNTININKNIIFWIMMIY